MGMINTHIKGYYAYVRGVIKNEALFKIFLKSIYLYCATFLPFKNF